MSLRAWLAVLVTGGLLGWCVEGQVFAAAQPKKNTSTKDKDKKKTQLFRCEGTIDAIDVGTIKVTAKDVAKHTLDIGKLTDIRITGPANLDFLKPGQYVQLSALLDKKSQRVKDPVTMLLVFTPTKDLVPGLSSDSSPAAVAAAGANEDVSIDWKPCVMAGSISAIDGRKIILNVPNLGEHVAVALTETAKIDVNVDDLSLAHPGDAIRVTKARKSGDQITLSDATIRCKLPLGAGSKRKVAAGSDSQAGKPKK